LYNNRLFGLCSKYNNDNSNISINNIINNNISSTINLNSNQNNYQSKNININSHKYFNYKNIFGYTNKNNDNKKATNNIYYINNGFNNIKDKSHIKNNSMKLEDFYSNLEQKELNKYKINNIFFNSINTETKIDNIKQACFNTESNDIFLSTKEQKAINKK
jgi:hypothetical protein